MILEFQLLIAGFLAGWLVSQLWLRRTGDADWLVKVWALGEGGARLGAPLNVPLLSLMRGTTLHLGPENLGNEEESVQLIGVEYEMPSGEIVTPLFNPDGGGKPMFVAVGQHVDITGAHLRP